MRGGLKWLNMGYRLHQRLLLTARADSLSLARDRSQINLKLCVELLLWPDVEDPVSLIDHAQPLDLTNSELGFGDELNDSRRL